jgi:hypothetical protein
MIRRQIQTFLQVLLVTSLGMTVLSSTAARLSATELVGSALLVERDVFGTIEGARYTKAIGDRVARDEILETGPSSATQIEFLDKTRLTIGPSSQVKVDNFVYSDGTKASKVAIELLIGGFRFISGKSGQRAYEIRTPHAVIGVRGTTIGFIVTADNTTVILKQGAISVCRRATRACTSATKAEQRIVVRAGVLQGPLIRRVGDPDFTDWCKNGGASCGL